MKSYFEQEILESLLKIELPMKYRVIGHRKGTHKSSVSGKNIDFKEHREYVQGDDVTKIDWKLFGRTEKLYIKEFEEDVSCNVFVVIDKSASMNYTSGSKNKLEYAKYLFAAIFTVFNRQGDNIGLGIFDEDFKLVFPPSKSGQSIYEINALLNDISPKGKTEVKKVPELIKKSFGRKINIVYVISDFIFNIEIIKNFIKGIDVFSNEVFLLHLTDPVEINFDFKGEYLFKDFETDKELILNANDMSDYYKNFYTKHVESIKTVAKKYNCRYFSLNTKLSYTENFMKILSHYNGS